MAFFPIIYVRFPLAYFPWVKKTTYREVSVTQIQNCFISVNIIVLLLGNTVSQKFLIMPHTLFIYLPRTQNLVSSVDKEIWRYFTVPVSASSSEDVSVLKYLVTVHLDGNLITELNFSRCGSIPQWVHSAPGAIYLYRDKQICYKGLDIILVSCMFSCI